jgi:RNA polymerase sigma factor (sigma-70 family)
MSTSTGDFGTDDAELARRFAAGDDMAFDALYRRYVGPIHDFVAGIVRNRTVAEDITQTVFLRVYEQRSALREPAAFRGWLYRIAHNMAMNQVGRAPRTEPIETHAPYQSPEPGPEQLAAREETAQLVWDAAASLEPHQYAVLDLALRKGLSSAEIAGVLGIPSAQASLAVHRAREALGNAVRFLVVARRRRHCERLAEMVPAGVRSLTAEQRASVDRHVRRCANCQRATAALTRPAELFGAIPLVALPAGLLAARSAQSAAAAHAAAARGATAHAAAATHVARRVGLRAALRHHWMVAVTATAVTAGAVTIGVVASEHDVTLPSTRHYELAGAFSEPAGYSYRVSASVDLGAPSGATPAALPPHDGLVTVPIGGTVTVTNTTPGHDAPDPLGAAAVDVDALYRFPSGACPGPDLLGDPIEPPGQEGALRTYIGGVGYCLVTLTALDASAPQQLAPGASLSLTIKGGLCGSVDTTTQDACPANPGPHSVSFVYARDHVGAAQRALAGPPGLLTISPLDLSAAPARSCRLSSDGYDGWVMASNRPVGGRCV